MNKRFENGKAPTSALSAEGSSPGSGATPGHEIPVITINLEELYDAVGGPDSSASSILEGILKAWGVKYSLLCNSSPDVGDEYFDEEFETLLDKYYEAYIEGKINEDPHVLTALHIAARRGADAVIDFRDGYESAIAIAWKR